MSLRVRIHQTKAPQNSTVSTVPALVARIHKALWLFCFSLSCFLVGCRTPQVPVVHTPQKYVQTVDRVRILSDFEIPDDHPLVEELQVLGKQIKTQLNLPLQQRDVVVYLFPHEESYRKFIQTTYPSLPDRRAYFVGSTRELSVYTYWGERIQEDLRHEYTHGILHACLLQVPLWLDEGLAEYFEVKGPVPGTINADYARQLSAALKTDWRPNLNRLENIQEFSAMTYSDYQEAWAWVHYLMHTSPDTQHLLLSYLREIQKPGEMPRLQKKLETEHPHTQVRFLSYLSTLQAPGLATLSSVISASAQSVNDETNAIPDFDEPQNNQPGFTQTEAGTVRLAEFSSPTPESTTGQIQNPTAQGLQSAIQLTYDVSFPSDLPASILLSGQSGKARLMDAHQLYREAHRVGWQECVDLFVDGELQFTDAKFAQKHVQTSPRYQWEIQKQGRIAGLGDCQEALLLLMDRYLESDVRTALSHPAKR